MEWYVILLIMFIALVTLMMLGIPVAFCFMLINVVGLFLLFGTAGLLQLIDNMHSSLATFVLLPVPLFILMGDVMFHSGIAPVLIRTLDMWLGKIPGRLSLLSVGAGVLFATLTGTSLASVAMLGSVLTPEMERQGYHKSMILGPILGSGGLAAMIPPSALAVLLGAIGEISVGAILMAIILPGILMAVIFAIYILVRCWLQPSLAPSYEVASVAWSEKLRESAKYILPQGIVVFLVIGVIFLGIATPSEAAATGAFGTVILALAYRRLNWKISKAIIKSTVTVTTMLFLIIAGSKAFSQIMAMTGAGAGLTQLAVQLQIAPIAVIIATQIVLLILGMFIDPFSMMMICIPIFLPVVKSLGFDPIWFAVLFMINAEVGGITPPFGMRLFVMKGVSPAGTTMGDCIRSAVPYIYLTILALILVMFVPSIALWLPAQMS